MINPETIDFSVLPSLPLEHRASLPQVACIYFAVDSLGQIQYVGRSVNLRNRWSVHHRSNQLEQIGGVRLVWLEISDSSLLPDIEAALIDWFAPPLNHAPCINTKKKSRGGCRELRINYAFVGEESWRKMMLLCEEMGFNKSMLMREFIDGFFQSDGEFYSNAGQIDAEARGMKEEDYFKALRDGTEDDLARYVNGRPGFGASPIDLILPIPADAKNKRTYNTIGLSAYNYVLLKVARIVDGSSMVQVVSRMLVKHLQDNWDKSYLPQIERDRLCKFK